MKPKLPPDPAPHVLESNDQRTRCTVCEQRWYPPKQPTADDLPAFRAALIDGFGPVDYQPGVGFERGRMPRYIYAAVQQHIGEGIRDGKFEVYECDRDGNERRENLRYHDPQYFADLGAYYLTGVWPKHEESLDDPLSKWQITEQGWVHTFNGGDFTAFIEERVDGLFTGCIVNAEHEYALSPETIGAWSTPEGAADALRRMWREG